MGLGMRLMERKTDRKTQYGEGYTHKCRPNAPEVTMLTVCESYCQSEQHSHCKVDTEAESSGEETKEQTAGDDDWLSPLPVGHSSPHIAG